MIVKGLDDKEHKWTFRKSKTEKRSKLHLKVREILREVYKFGVVHEEVTLPGTKRQGRSSLLYADFYLPSLNLMIEVHGQQHYEYNSHFYKDKYSFYRANARDRDKKEWCEINDIDMLELKYNEQDQWREEIVRSIS